MLWELVPMKKTQEKILRLGVWKARGLRKDGFGRYLTMKGEKGKKFSFICKDRPKAGSSSLRKLFLPFLSRHMWVMYQQAMI